MQDQNTLMQTPIAGAKREGRSEEQRTKAKRIQWEKGKLVAFPHRGCKKSPAKRVIVLPRPLSTPMFVKYDMTMTATANSMKMSGEIHCESKMLQYRGTR